MMRAFNSSRSRWVSVLTVARVPTGMKIGVSMTPCGVCRRPARAPVRSSQAMSSKVKAFPFLLASSIIFT